MMKEQENIMMIKRLDNLKALLSDLRELDAGRYLTSAEVQQMLNISSSTLQTWRREKTIPYTIIRNKIFYKLEDIHSAMEKYKIK